MTQQTSKHYIVLPRELPSSQPAIFLPDIILPPHFCFFRLGFGTSSKHRPDLDLQILHPTVKRSLVNELISVRTLSASLSLNLR